jgi:protein-S-isoprenylcysteine O-methyltransferase Ste14
MNRGILGWTLVAIQFMILIVVVLLPRTTPTLPRMAIGVPIIAAGVALGLTAMLHLGSALTPTPVPIQGAGLRTGGAYRYVRHPIYSAILLMAIGYAVVMGSLWTWVAVAVLAVFFVIKSRWEDSLLAAAYGDPWLEWSEGTGALVPRLRRRGSPG